MSWEPTAELRWLEREIKTDPFYIPLNAKGERVTSTISVLQQRWRWRHGADVYMEPEYEWRDVPHADKE
jgi:hypothetical protein